MVFHCIEKFLDSEKFYQQYFDLFPYSLSDFQKWTIYAIVNGHHSLVTAHTGSGKTLPAEFAIQFFKKLNKKVIYTAPIKALCNQKLYDLKLKYPHISFGILTGDVKDNPEADVLIMTTEILRNTLFTKKINETNKFGEIATTDKPKEMEDGESHKQEGKSSISLHFEMDFNTELGAVVFDEVHYIGDQDRGSVWEQAILLLPSHVQLIMLSATIEKPEIFASWLENEKNKLCKERKELYMTTTYERVVPLSHYMWITNHQSSIQKVKNTPYESKFKEIINKPVLLANSDGKFYEQNYYKAVDILNYINKNQDYIKRQFILNELVKYLNRNNMLPAICFVFSRKNVELCAKEITFNLFDKDDKTSNIIEHECEKILISKLKNYKEYTNLEEYKTMVSLLKKGIAIHHAGIMPILREMVELLFEKKYIKLLFATETFAVGINMPTKTVIFTSVSKFSGDTTRYLLSHEYTQMAGRAGRRGIDTIGNVIHCNNLFKIPEHNTYKKMLTGPPKMLTSQFKISYNIILNIISTKANSLCHSIDNELITFMESSFIQNDIVKEINNYDKIKTELISKISEVESILNNPEICNTPREILIKYFDLQTKLTIVPNKQKKKIQRELTQMETDNRYLKTDIEKYENLKKLQIDLEKNSSFKLNVINYIQTNIDTIIGILKESKFIDYDFRLTYKGIVAMQLQEVHCLALGDLYEEFKGFELLSASQLASLFSCFTNISMSSDKKLEFPSCSDSTIKLMTESITTYINKYYDMECSYQLDTGTDYTLHYELIDTIQTWCNANDEISCRKIIIQLKEEKDIFLGEFVKAILKINNIAREFEKICESLQNFDLLQKIKLIPELTLKYVATNQSLYI